MHQDKCKLGDLETLCTSRRIYLYSHLGSLSTIPLKPATEDLGTIKYWCSRGPDGKDGLVPTKGLLGILIRMGKVTGSSRPTVSFDV